MASALVSKARKVWSRPLGGTLPSKMLRRRAAAFRARLKTSSQELAGVIARYLKLKEWKDTGRIVIGGGFRASRIGELVTGRTMNLLKEMLISYPFITPR